MAFEMLIHNKDDIQFVTEFQCFLGHPVVQSLLLHYIDKLLKYPKQVLNYCSTLLKGKDRLDMVVELKVQCYKKKTLGLRFTISK